MKHCSSNKKAAIGLIALDTTDKDKDKDNESSAISHWSSYNRASKDKDKDNVR